MSTSTPRPVLVSSVPALKTFLSSISPSSTLYLDFEGNKLSRHGSLSLITILVHPQGEVHLIDVLALGNSTFTTSSSNKNKTLKSIFEDPDTPKCFWDVRNDADALWALYGVDLAGVTDVQLLENASRTENKTYVRGLDKCVQCDLKLGFMDLNRWLRTKRDLSRLLSTTNAFSARPIDTQTLEYCANDVIHLPKLHATYLERIGGGNWLAKVMDESARRVAEAYAPAYDPQGPSKKLGPWGVGTKQREVTMEEMIDQWEIDRWDDQEEGEIANGFFDFDNEVGYYDDDHYDDDVTNCADGAQDPEAFDNGWDRGS